MPFQRIVSFLPSATELLFELGVGDKIVGTTHECQFPKEARVKPRVITSIFDSKLLSSNEIDQKTSQLIREGKDLFILHEDILKKAQPDLIISQKTCEVCAAHANQLNRALQILEREPQIFSMDPHNVSEILDCVTLLAKLVGKEKEGKVLKDNLQSRLDILKGMVIKEYPRVLSLEWIDPFFSSGHWVPELVELAGGKNQISRTGDPSRRLYFEEIENSEPEIIILMPCGFDIERINLEYNKTLKKNSRWNEIPAVKNGKIYSVDASSYFSKPSIRAVTGAEILAKIIHPQIYNLNIPINSFQLIK